MKPVLASILEDGAKEAVEGQLAAQTIEYKRLFWRFAVPNIKIELIKTLVPKYGYDFYEGIKRFFTQDEQQKDPSQ